MDLARVKWHRALTATAMVAALAALWLLSDCAHAPLAGERLVRRGDEIVACGQLFHTGAPVVLWNDVGGYDAYRTQARFSGADAKAGDKPRFDPLRGGLAKELAARVARTGWDLADLQQVVRCCVLHYDVAGTSRQCFKTLHDVRGLSVHFLLDVDGTLYQTLDLKEHARHARGANDASVGVEIAHIGAYASPDATELRDWYRQDADGPFVHFPDWLREPGVRTPGFLPRPARPQLLHGVIHGRTYYQYDFTEPQYRALAKLLAALHRTFPAMRLDFPRDAAGRVLDRALTPEELGEFAGVIGHWHVTAAKIDPGPALDWERLMALALDEL